MVSLTIAQNCCQSCFYGYIPSHSPFGDFLKPGKHLQFGALGNNGSTTQIELFPHWCSLGQGRESVEKVKKISQFVNILYYLLRKS